MYKQLAQNYNNISNTTTRNQNKVILTSVALVLILLQVGIFDGTDRNHPKEDNSRIMPKIFIRNWEDIMWSWPNDKVS